MSSTSVPQTRQAVKHMEHVTKFYSVGRDVDCELYCSCGEVLFGYGGSRQEAHDAARALWYEHLHLVQANRMEVAA